MPHRCNLSKCVNLNFSIPVFIKTPEVFISLASPEPRSRALGGPFEDDEWRSGATRSRNIFREVVKIAVVSAHLLLAGFRLGSNWDTSHLKDGEEIFVVLLTGGGKLKRMMSQCFGAQLI